MEEWKTHLNHHIKSTKVFRRTLIGIFISGLALHAYGIHRMVVNSEIQKNDYKKIIEILEK